MTSCLPFKGKELKGSLSGAPRYLQPELIHCSL